MEQRTGPCATCGKPIASALDARACNGAARHLHHAPCAERVGVCGVRGCGAIGFHAADAPAAVPAVSTPAAPVPAREPVWIPARWDGACVTCPACHGVSPWPATGCAFCHLSLEEQARRDPAWLARCTERTPPPAVRSVALGVRFLAVLHLEAGALVGAAAATYGASALRVHGEIGDPAEIELWAYAAPKLVYCLAMALLLNALVRRLERGSRPARAVLFAYSALCAYSLVGIPIAALLAIPMLFRSSREYFRR